MTILRFLLGAVLALIAAAAAFRALLLALALFRASAGVDTSAVLGALTAALLIALAGGAGARKAWRRPAGPR